MTVLENLAWKDHFQSFLLKLTSNTLEQGTPAPAAAVQPMEEPGGITVSMRGTASSKQTR